MGKLNPTLRQLRVFESVVEQGGFTRAAEKLHLSQPAVSIQVKQLEGIVGMPLFDQLGKKIYPTDAGRTLYECAQNIFAQLEDTEEAIDALKGVRRGRLKVAVATTAGYFATRMLATFASRYPEIIIRLDVTNRLSLLKQLDENAQDMVIMGEPPADRDLLATAFMENPLVVVAAADHPLTRRERIPLSDLQDQRFVVREPGSGTRAAVQRFFDAEGVSVQFSMEMSSNEAIKQAVQAGLGLGISSLNTMELELETGRLMVLDVVGFPILRYWYLVRRTGKKLSPVGELFRDFVLNEGAQAERGVALKKC